MPYKDRPQSQVVHFMTFIFLVPFAQAVRSEMIAEEKAGCFNKTRPPRDSSCLSDDAGTGIFSIPCAASFGYRGRTYNTCIVAERERAWCKHYSDSYQWGYCEPSNACLGVRHESSNEIERFLRKTKRKKPTTMETLGSDVDLARVAPSSLSPAPSMTPSTVLSRSLQPSTSPTSSPDGGTSPKPTEVTTPSAPPPTDAPTPDGTPTSSPQSQPPTIARPSAPTRAPFVTGRPTPRPTLAPDQTQNPTRRQNTPVPSPPLSPNPTRPSSQTPEPTIAPVRSPQTPRPTPGATIPQPITTAIPTRRQPPQTFEPTPGSPTPATPPPSSTSTPNPTRRRPTRTPNPTRRPRTPRPTDRAPSLAPQTISTLLPTPPALPPTLQTQRPNQPSPLPQTVQPSQFLPGLPTPSPDSSPTQTPRPTSFFTNFPTQLSETLSPSESLSPAVLLPSTSPTSLPTVDEKGIPSAIPTTIDQTFNPSNAPSTQPTQDGQEGPQTVPLSPFTLFLATTSSLSLSRIQTRLEDELLEIMQQTLLIAYSEVLDPDQVVVGMQLILFDSKISGDSAIVMIFDIEGSVFFAPTVTNLPSTPELDVITKRSLESEEFLQNLQSANNPVLASTVGISVQFPETFSPTQAPNGGGSNNDTLMIALLVVAGVAVVSAFVFVYVVLIRPRLNRRYNMDFDSPRSEAGSTTIGLLELDAGVVSDVVLGTANETIYEGEHNLRTQAAQDLPVVNTPMASEVVLSSVQSHMMPSKKELAGAGGVALIDSTSRELS